LDEQAKDDLARFRATGFPIRSGKSNEQQRVENKQARYMADQYAKNETVLDVALDRDSRPPRNMRNHEGDAVERKLNSSDRDTPIPQLSPVKRAQKAAERQRMKTPGMGDVKTAERREAQTKTVGSMLRGQMMKQQGKK